VVARRAGADRAWRDTVAGSLIKHFKNSLDVQFTAKYGRRADKIEDGEMDWKQVPMDFINRLKPTWLWREGNEKYVPGKPCLRNTVVRYAAKKSRSLWAVLV